MKLLVLLLTILLTCGRPENGPLAREDASLEVQERINAIRTWAVTCTFDRTLFACKHPLDGDAVLWNGLLCLSGEIQFCSAVNESVSIDGKLNRSPYWEANVRQSDSFSRDMFIGLMAYLIKTKDIELALRVQSYIQANDNKLCTDATDSRCTMTSTTWGLMAHVWEHLGLITFGNMLSHKSTYTFVVASQAAFSPKGFESHLVASHLVLCKFLGIEDRYTEQAANELAKKDPNNPLFVWLAAGYTDQVVQLLLQQLPTESHAGRENLQWSIERDTAQQHWLRSMGWEWIYLSNLINRK